MWPKLNTMKHFVTLVACLASFFALAQNPNYDPDSNGDDLIGAEDLVSLLGVYNTSLAVDTTLECDFEGTAEEEWLFGVFTGEVVIDSVVVQFSISDSATYYEPGCPTLQVFYLDVDMEYTLQTTYEDESNLVLESYYPNPWGASDRAYLEFFFNSNSGQASWRWYDWNLDFLRFVGAPYNATFNFAVGTDSHYACINSGGNTFSFTEEGLVGDLRCNGQVTNTGPWNDPEYNYFRILPFWHYAE